MVVSYGAEQHSTQKLKSFMSGPKYKYNNYDKKNRGWITTISYTFWGEIGAILTILTVKI